jgi:hypothetical protein
VAASQTPRTELLHLGAIAEQYGLPKASVRQLIAAGKLPVVTFGPRRLWVKRGDLEALIAASTEVRS